MNALAKKPLINDFQDKRHYLDSADTANQIELEQLYAKSQLLPALREDFHTQFNGELIEVTRLALRFALENPSDDPSETTTGFSVAFLVDLMAHVAIRKRAPIEVFVGLLARHFEEAADSYQTCADAIVCAASYDVVTLLDRELPGNGGAVLEIVMLHEPTLETQTRIEQFQYPLPMIEPPCKIVHNRQTGYRTQPLQGSLILKSGNHHDDDICLDHLNRVNAFNLAINQDVVAFIQNSWKNLGQRKPDETWLDFQKRQKAFQKYDRSSRDVIVALTIQPQGFWLTHKYDKRGRTYAQGYHVNYQGNDWNKSVVCLRDAEPLNPE